MADVTHDQSAALAVSGQIVVMNAGRIAQAGTPQALCEQPDTECVAGFTGEAMRFCGDAHDDSSVRLRPRTVGAHRPVSAGPVKVTVRPAAWQAAGPGAGALSETVVVSSDVQRRWRNGEEVGLRLCERSLSMAAAGR